MTDPIPEFYCAECGRYLGKLAAHVILDDDRVICSRHRIDHERRGDIKAGFCSRATAATLLGLWPRGD
jgi:hypothetical protein